MRLSLAISVVASCSAWLALAQSTGAKKPAAKSTQTAAKTPAKAKTTAKTTTKSTSAGKKKTSAASRTPARYRRPSQLQPTAQRYREIQQALADHGYFQGTIDGNWGPDSVDALKRFQREQNLMDDGKLTSLSLIALGLGSPHGIVPAQPLLQQ